MAGSIKSIRETFDTIFPGFGYLHARSEPVDPSALRFVHKAAEFNTLTNDPKVRNTKEWLDRAWELVTAAENEFPNLLSIADSDQVGTGNYRAEHHLETRVQPKLSGEYYEIELVEQEIENYPLPPQLTLEEWSLNKFPQRTGKVPYIGRVGPDIFGKTCDVRVFNLPIRMPGETIVRVPIEYKHHEEYIKSAVSHAYAMTRKYQKENPDYADTFFYYLTVDQKHLAVGQRHRGPEPHVDDMQGPRYVLKKLPSGWSYLVSDIGPTTFYDQVFDFSNLSENSDDIWTAIEKAADEAKTYVLEPNQIGLMSYYDVHRGSQMLNNCTRTFSKIAITPKIFDMSGDSINPAFEKHTLKAFPYITYPWRYTSRRVPKFVSLDNYQSY